MAKTKGKTEGTVERSGTGELMKGMETGPSAMLKEAQLCQEQQEDTGELSDGG